MGVVDYAWLIPALPLASFVVIVFFTRVMDVRASRAASIPAGATDVGHPAGLTHEEAESANRGPTDQPGAPAGGHDVDTLRAVHGGHGPGSTAMHEDAAHGTHGTGEHGGHTPFWARISGYVSILGIIAAWVISVAIFIQFLTNSSLQTQGKTIQLYEWFSFSGSTLQYPINFHIDPLTAVMLLVVTTVSMLVQIYSQGYMQGDPGFSRFFAWLSLFTVSMLILVLADNFLVIYIGLELVGLCSYLLIGFWFERPPAARAALKAFITTRVGDFAMMIGILLLFLRVGSLRFDDVFRAVGAGALAGPALTAAALLVFGGAVGKSAQVPLHVWLPDAMEGPTPVSALIHAATMVAAGVYLVARVYPLFYLTAGH